MTDKEFELSTKLAWSMVEPWLRLNFGDKCPEFEYGCECCQRWRLAEQLLAVDRIGTPADIQRGIAELEDALKWRRELVASWGGELVGDSYELPAASVEMLAETPLHDWHDENGPGEVTCVVCGGSAWMRWKEGRRLDQPSDVVHLDDCPVEIAKALLKSNV